MLADGFYALVLIAALDSNSFRARESAHAALERMEMRVYPSLMLAQPRSAEQRRRLDLLRARFNDITADVLCGTAPPWLDALPLSGMSGVYPAHARDGILYQYLERARPFASRYPGPYPEYRLATRLLVGDLLSNGRRRAAEELASRLRKRCQHWSGNPPAPPE